MKNEIKNAGLKKLIVVLAVIATLIGVLPVETFDVSNWTSTTTYAATYEENETEVAETTEEEEVVEEPVVEEPAYTVEEMSATLYAQQASNVRKGPSTDYEVIGGLSTNDEVKVTGKANTGWYQISYKGEVGFVSNSLLKDSKVVIETPAATPAANSYSAPASAAGKARWQLSEKELIQLCLSECITPGMGDFEKAVAINNYLCYIMQYDKSYSHVSTFDALAYGTGVCQGYANAYKKLMDAAGVPTDYVSGTANGGRHAWNRSLINGVYYYTDVCWNDSATSPNAYLLISYEQMSLDHFQQEINRTNRVM